LDLRGRKWGEVGEDYITRIFKTWEDEMGEACSMHGRDKKFVQYFGGKFLTEETIWNI
jgi:hypothetical protein